MERRLMRRICLCSREAARMRRENVLRTDSRLNWRHYATSTQDHDPKNPEKSSQQKISSEAELLYKRPNLIRPPNKTTSNEYLHRIHSLLYPPPVSEISAFANRIPRLPKEFLKRSDSLEWVERCLVSSSFWKGIEDGDVRIEDLKKSVSRWKIFNGKDSDDGGKLYLPGKLTSAVTPDQSMDSNPKMHPFGSKRRSNLREQQKPVNPDLDRIEVDPDWMNNYPIFTNFLDNQRLHNEELATLGNSILGVLGAEWLERRYPHLPTKAFQAALTMYVGPRTCADVSRLWGVSSGTGLANLTIENKPKIESAGIFAGGIFDIDGKPKNKGLKHKQDGSSGEEVSSPGLLRWRRAEMMDRNKEVSHRASAFKQGILYEDAMASVSRAFVGLVYTLYGMKPAREFVRANWFSRKAQVGDLLKFTNPFLVLKYTLAKYNREPPVARLLRESGRASATAIFSVGSYSGTLKLGEAFGTSKKMAEYHAHEDALRRIYLSPGFNEDERGQDGYPVMPSDTLTEPIGYEFKLPSALGDLEVDEESSTSSGRLATESWEDILLKRRQNVISKIQTSNPVATS